MQVVLASRRALLLDAPQGVPSEFGDPNRPLVHLVVIGDSTSVGIGATSAEWTYPWLLSSHLAGSFYVKLDVIGRAGARMLDAAVEFAPRAVELRPDVVVVGIGANDVTHATSLTRFAGYLRTVITTLEAAGGEVLVALGPRFDAPALPRPLRYIAKARARSINRAIRRVAGSNGVEVLDLPGGIGRAFAMDRGLYCVDGFHPSDRGYALWAEVMKDKVMAAALRSQRPDAPDNPKGFGRT
jgi:lysophospholipase L1-like esterase